MRTQLENGLTVVFEENHATPVVAFQAWVGVGSADEGPGQEGIAHVFEHMLFKGTAKRGVGQIAQEIEAAGGDINAWTSFDQTVFHVVMASREFDMGLEILSDALLNSSFNADELERERKVVLEELKQGEDSPSRMVSQALFEVAYGKHPYGRPVIGYRRTVEAMQRTDMLDFFGQWYVPNNITLIVVGDFDSKSAMKKVKTLLGRAKPRPLARINRLRTPPRGPRSIVVSRDVRESHMAIGFQVPGLVHEDAAALDVLAVVLGQGESSRLSRNVRREKQLATDIYAYAFTPRDDGLFAVGATTTMEQLDKCFDATLAETMRLLSERASGAEVGKAKTILLSDSTYQKETVQGLARKLGFYEVGMGDLAFEQIYERRVREVTPETLMAVANRYLQPDRGCAALLVTGGTEAKRRSAEKAWTKRAKAKLTQTGRRLVAERKAAEKSSRKSGKGLALATRSRPLLARHVLNNGLRLLIASSNHVPTVAVRGVWLGGLRYENEAQAGINNLLASLMVRGTENRTAEVLSHEIEAMAASLGGFSGRNSFGLRGEFLAEHFEVGFDIFCECLLAPSFPAEEIAKERKEILEEIASQDDSPASVAFRLFAETLYKHHPYQRDLLGKPATVKRLKQDDLTSFYRSSFPLAGLALAIVGDIRPEEVVEAVELRLGHGSRSSSRGRGAPPKVKVAPEIRPDKPRRAIRHLEREQAHLVVGFLGTTLHDPDRYAFEVLSTVLSGQGGRLFVELRDKQGLAYRVSAFSQEGLDPGYFAVYIATSPKNVVIAESGIWRELDRMRTTRVPKDELERAKRYLIGTHEVALQRRGALASTMAFHECYGQGFDEHLRYVNAISKVSSDRLLELSRRYFQEKHSVTTLVTPRPGLKGIKN